MIMCSYKPWGNLDGSGWNSGCFVLHLHRLHPSPHLGVDAESCPASQAGGFGSDRADQDGLPWQRLLEAFCTCSGAWLEALWLGRRRLECCLRRSTPGRCLQWHWPAVSQPKQGKTKHRRSVLASGSTRTLKVP